jgi:hypothetical protein
MTNRTDRPEATEGQPAEPVSRRGMLRFGALAAAAAAGTAGAAVVAAPAQAAPGDAIKIDDATNAGAGTTTVTGSSLAVKAGNAATKAGVPNTAVLASPAAGAASGVGVAGIGAGSTGAGLYVSNPSGPSLLVEEYAGEFPPQSGRWKQGAVISTQWGLFECVYSDDAATSQTVWAPLTNLGVEFFLLPQPVRVYASTKDDQYGRAKIARNQVRRISTLWRADGTDVSGVPPWATSVVASVQLESTETNTGYLAIASGDVAAPGGFATTVWSAAGFSGVTAFNSALGQDTETTWGTLSVAAYSANAYAKTHFYIDVVGFYADTLAFGGPNGVALQADRKVLNQLKDVRSNRSKLPSR